MWKWKKKRKDEAVNSEAGEALPSKNEKTAATATEKEEVALATEEAPSAESEAESATTEGVPPSQEKEVREVIKETAPSEETAPSGEEEVKVLSEKAVTEEEELSAGVFIFGNKIESRFKKFLTALFSIFLLPPVIVFGLLIITVVVLIAFPLVSIILPITLLSLAILFIALPVVIPFLTVVSLITGKGKIQFGLKNKKFAIKALGITFPPFADRNKQDNLH